MTKRRDIILWICAWAVLWTGCSKEASYRTDLQLKPLIQHESSSRVEPLRTMVAYAFESLDTVRWTVASYDDALQGIVTEKATGKTRQDGIKASPLLGGIAGEEGGNGGTESGNANGGGTDGGNGGDNGDDNSDNEGGDGSDGSDDDPMATWLTMRVNAPRVLLVVADTETEQYGYEELPLAVNLSPLTVSAVFYPWTQAAIYRSGSWWMFNPTYIPAEESPLQVYPLAAPEEGSEPQVLTQVVLHLYEGYDGSEWRPLSYEDAVEGILTHRATGGQITPSAAFRPINKGDRPGRWGAVVGERSAVVVVDTAHRQYAMATLDPGSRTDPACYDLLFLPWVGASQYSSGVWTVINAPDPEEPENPEDPEDPENPENPEDPENPNPDNPDPENPENPETSGKFQGVGGGRIHKEIRR